MSSQYQSTSKPQPYFNKASELCLCSADDESETLTVVTSMTPKRSSTPPQVATITKRQRCISLDGTVNEQIFSSDEVQAQIKDLANTEWRVGSNDASTSTVVYRRYIDTPNPALALSCLDQYQYFQRHLWSELLSHSASRRKDDRHDWLSLRPTLFSIIALFNFSQDTHPTRASAFLDTFDEDAEATNYLVEAIFRIGLQYLNHFERGMRLSFLSYIFRALDHESVRQALLPLLSLSVWIHLSNEACEEQLENFPYLRKPLSKLRRRASRKPRPTPAKVSETAIFSLVTELEAEVTAAMVTPSIETLSVIIFSVNLLAELLSQIRLRRTLLPLLCDRATLPLLQGLSLDLQGQSNVHTWSCWPDWVRVLDLFVFYVTFPIHPVSGRTVSQDAIRMERSKRLLALQRVAYAGTQRKSLSPIHPLSTLAMGSHDDIGTLKVLYMAFSECPSDILCEMLDALKLRNLRSIAEMNYGNVSNASPDIIAEKSRKLLMNALASYCETQRDALEGFRAAPLMITEQDIWGPQGANNTRSSQVLPFLNLEFLNMHDYMLRNFTLLKWESAWSIREDLEDALTRVNPSFENCEVKFSGWAKMAAPLLEVKVVDVGHQLLDSPAPSHVTVQIDLCLQNLPKHIRQEWYKVQQHDVLFLVKFSDSQMEEFDASQPDHLDLLFRSCAIRGLTVIKHGSVADDAAEKMSQTTNLDRSLVLSGSIDRLQYYYDVQTLEKGMQPFDGYNLAVRRPPQVNNFFPLLSSLQDLILSDKQILPDWLEDTFLGRSVIQSKSTHVQKIEEIEDLLDTFVDEDHLRSAFPSTKISSTLSRTSEDSFPSRTCFKLKVTCRDGVEAVDAMPYKGPFVSTFLSSSGSTNPVEAFNSVRFTRVQVEAIRSSVRHGISLISGPPGTGKTSCLVQLASILYHTKPRERIVVITRTNHALNDFVEKLLQRHIDPLTILRLGQGGSDVSADELLSKAGRIDALLKGRLELLSLVDRLSKSMGFSHQAEYWTCESANMFYREIVQPVWERFCSRDNRSWEEFPFKRFVDDTAYSKTFPGVKTAADNIVENRSEPGRSQKSPVRYFHLISSIFKELASLQFLEILQTARQRGNYLVTCYARIIAMTMSHAALQRRDLLSQCFSYDTLIIEDAAEMLEVEAFLCITMQRSDRLKRIVLVGDHQQLTPGLQDKVLQQKCNFGQSLFARLIRLRNRIIRLDEQGRSRPLIADLFRWRYPGLRDMDFISKDHSFRKTNPGLLYTAQFINTGELSSESQPLPHVYQNIAEAEYIAFTFLYMRMLGYPCESIAVLASYNGQVQLLTEVISSRSAQYGNLGMPLCISTVDKFQGREADYVLLSLVRTKGLGHLKDVRRITVAVSRARHGLYIYGFLSLFSSCAEFEPVLAQLEGKHSLTLVSNETFTRTSDLASSDSRVSNCREVHSPADMADIVSHLHRAKMRA